LSLHGSEREQADRDATRRAEAAIPHGQTAEQYARQAAVFSYKAAEASAAAYGMAGEVFGRIDSLLRRVERLEERAESAAATPPPSHRPALPSWSDLDEDGEEIQTDHGGRRRVFTREQAERVAASTFTRMQTAAQQARDAAPVAFVRAKVVPAALVKVGQLGIVGLAVLVWHWVLARLHL